MRYSVGRFRREMKEAFEKAKLGDEVSIIRMGEEYRLTLRHKVQSLEEGVASAARFKQFVETAKPVKYGCGCKVVEGKKLCTKHGRL